MRGSPARQQRSSQNEPARTSAGDGSEACEVGFIPLCVVDAQAALLERGEDLAAACLCSPMLRSLQSSGPGLSEATHECL